MISQLTKICVFVHYSIENFIPLNVQVYVNELTNYFDEVRLITNEREIKKDPVFAKNVSIRFEKNEGYDFGMFYKFIMSENIDNYSQIAFVNDSNILINKLNNLFDWGETNNADFWGLVDSNEDPWFSSHKNTYHIQSHFIVLNQKAIEKLPSYLDSIDSDSIFKEYSSKKLRRLVIDKWEIGLSQFLIKHGLTNDAYFKSSSFTKKYNLEDINITHVLPEELINEGYPLLKKKVYAEGRKTTSRSNNFWDEVIKEYGNEDWELSEILIELNKMYMIKSDIISKSLLIYIKAKKLFLGKN